MYQQNPGRGFAGGKPIRMKLPGFRENKCHYAFLIRCTARFLGSLRAEAPQNRPFCGERGGTRFPHTHAHEANAYFPLGRSPKPLFVLVFFAASPQKNQNKSIFRGFATLTCGDFFVNRFAKRLRDTVAAAFSRGRHDLCHVPLRQGVWLADAEKTSQVGRSSG